VRRPDRRTDDELLLATRRDPEAFGVFYERHATHVLRFLGRATGDTELALDLTAEVFAAALAGSSRYRPGGPPAAAWLFDGTGLSQAAVRQRVSRGLAKLTRHGTRGA
jgi:RNA polymerase sigma-70 factor (ECF subfamily)